MNTAEDLQVLDFVFRFTAKTFIYSQLLRCSTARGSDSGLFLGGPTKVKARKFHMYILMERDLHRQRRRSVSEIVVNYLWSIQSDISTTSPRRNITKLLIQKFVVTLPI